MQQGCQKASPVIQNRCQFQGVCVATHRKLCNYGWQLRNILTVTQATLPIVFAQSHVLFSLLFQGGQYDAKNFLLYYYYGGMIYTALKNYERALYFFEVVSKIFTHVFCVLKCPLLVWTSSHGHKITFQEVTMCVQCVFKP